MTQHLVEEYLEPADFDVWVAALREAPRGPVPFAAKANLLVLSLLASGRTRGVGVEAIRRALIAEHEIYNRRRPDSLLAGLAHAIGRVMLRVAAATVLGIAWEVTATAPQAAPPEVVVQAPAAAAETAPVAAEPTIMVEASPVVILPVIQPPVRCEVVVAVGGYQDTRGGDQSVGIYGQRKLLMIVEALPAPLVGSHADQARKNSSLNRITPADCPASR